jgi:hypothetical protein
VSFSLYVLVFGAKLPFPFKVGAFFSADTHDSAGLGL